MNRYTVISFFALLSIVIILPFYTWLEPQRMARAQEDLRAEFVREATMMYVESCAVCHGASGEGIGAMPALDSEGLRTADYDILFKTIARGRYDTAMAAWHQDEGGIYNDYQVDQLIALIRYGQWPQVSELAAAQGMIPPTLPVPEVDEALLANVADLAPKGSEWAAGMQLYANNCTICHGVSGEGSDMGATLQTAAVRSRPAHELARIISTGVPGTLMAGWENALTPAEISSLVAFLQNWDTILAAGMAMTPPAPVKIDLNNPEEVMALGEQIYNTTCVACHGENGSGGTGPVLNSQQILTRKTDEALVSIVVNGGHRPNSTMPAFGDRMTMVEIEAVVAYLRAWEPTAPYVANPRGTAQGGGPPWLNSGTDGTTQGQGRGQGQQGQGQGQQGQGQQGQGQGQGGPPWRDTATEAAPQTAPENESGQPLTIPGTTDVIQFRGMVVAVNENALTFLTADGTELDAMLGPPWFWSENGVPLAPGDKIELEGFQGTEHMELNWISNLTTGQTLNLRTPTGQPVWGSGE